MECISFSRESILQVGRREYFSCYPKYTANCLDREQARVGITEVENWYPSSIVGFMFEGRQCDNVGY